MVLRPDPRHLGIPIEMDRFLCPKCTGTGRLPFNSLTARGYIVCEICKGTGKNPNPPPPLETKAAPAPAAKPVEQPKK